MNKHLELAAMALAALASTALAVAPVHAQDSDNHVSASVGVTGQGEMTWRASLAHDWDRSWWQSERGYLTGYWDTAYTYWEGSDASGAHSLSFSPVLVYQFNGDRVRPFVEFGIGVSLFSSTDVGERDRACVPCIIPTPASRTRTTVSKATPCFTAAHCRLGIYRPYR